jgi:hypothetical protein
LFAYFNTVFLGEDSLNIWWAWLILVASGIRSFNKAGQESICMWYLNLLPLFVMNNHKIVLLIFYWKI